MATEHDARHVRSDPRRLERLLEGRLPAEEQAALEEHLGDCPACRDAFDAAAAGEGVWADAAAFLRDDPLDGETAELAFADPTGFAAGDRTFALAGGEVTADRPEVHRLEEYFDPTDDPRMLGRFGGYEVAGVVGDGGMGVVLKGYEPALDRFVAIKVLAPHLAASGAARARFAREAKAAAAVLHENVVAIHRVAEANGLPYLVMPYLAGESLQKRLDDRGPLEALEALRIGAQVAAGLAAAHARGLVHRDVKPGNVLLDKGVERVVLTDFGLARAADDASLTRSGVIAGTPQFMSPEQARGEPVDHRSDLFSLGSLLYAMLAGRPPFRAETAYGVLRKISDSEPRPLRELAPQTPEWLADIVARLMAKRPGERCDSAAEVAELLGAWIAHLQRPGDVPPPARPGRRFPRRAPFLGVGIVVAVALLAAAWAAAVWTARSPSDETVVSGHTGPVYGFAYDRRSERLLTGGKDSSIRVWDAGRMRPVRAIHYAHRGPVTDTRFHPRGDRFVSAGTDGRAVVWDVASGRELLELRHEQERVESAVFSPDGSRVATAGWDKTVRLWDAASGEEVGRIAHRDGVNAVAYSPDGRTLVSGDWGGRIRVFDAATLAERKGLTGHRHGVIRVAFSPDGRTLASAGWDGTVRLWDPAGGRALRTLTDFERAVLAVAFDADGRRVAAGGQDRHVLVWDAETGAVLARFEGHADHVQGLAFAPDDGCVMSTGKDGTIRRWDLDATVR